MFSRLAGAVILRYMKPKTFLIVSAVLAIAGFAMLLVPSKAITTVALFVIALGYANMFPLIFSIAIDKMPEKSNELSGLMVTAIVGAAILPPIMGLVADVTTNQIAFIVPFVATAYILGLALLIKPATK